MNIEEKSKITLEFEKYLESINGLENGYFTDRPTIKERYFFSVDDGWIPLVQNLIKEAIEAGWNKEICQVKEKFGGLRFYINSASNEVHNIISKYESLSYKTCEICGENGELRKGGWWKTLCEKHNIENEEKKLNK